ncbi:MAG TPA: sn-glycerol-3-phosphate ABC transporter ATP-binding protein UgpC [Thermoanaerobaculia bacterium]|nr:sn-glycerol-3-phosphate ABC transporter ATP-binding protein UgpC [Thermoanaerobaculia bacterium]
MAAVRFDNVVKRYGAVSVIEDLTLEVRDQEFMVLVGPSGCGKSTALRMIAGLEEITAGTISIGDRVVNDLQPKDRDTAMVFQTYALYPHMSVRDNLGFGLKMRKAPKEEIARRVDDAAEILGITQLLDRRPRQLSGGQRQRVALGRAIVRNPAVFLFDEPLSNLDAKLRVQMRAEITKLQQRLETTSVYVTHDQVEAMTMGHRIAVMNAGRVQQVGTPLEVYDRPANVFVAQFIGTPPMNFFPAKVTDGRIQTGSFTLPLPQAHRPWSGSGEVLVGIRPENLLEPGKEGKGETAQVTATVELVELVGHEAVVHLRAGDALFIASFDAHRAPRAGQTITAGVELERIHLFDARTEMAIRHQG